MRLDLKAVYNPLTSDFEFSFDGEPYVIPKESLWVNVGYVVTYAARKLAEKVLEDRGEEDPVNSPKKGEVVEELLSHEYEIVDKTIPSKTVEGEKPLSSEEPKTKKKGGKK